MSKLVEALRRKFGTPQAAIAALGLDANILEDPMQYRLSPRAQFTEGALYNYLRPRLAMDQRVPELAPVLAPVTSRNYRDQIPIIAAAVRNLTRGRLAQDADIDDLTDRLEEIGREREGTDDLEPNSAIPAGGERFAPEAEREPYEMDEDLDEMMDSRGCDARRRLGRDETEEERDEREERESAEDARRRMGRDEYGEESEIRRQTIMDSRLRRAARDRRRVADARDRLGRDETEEEEKDRRDGEEAEDRRRAADRARARDAKRASDRKRRAADMKKKMGRDASEEELDKEEREKEAHDLYHRAKDRMTRDRHADDRGGHLKRARDAMGKARDFWRSGDRKRAEDAMKEADDAMTRFSGDEPAPFRGMPRIGGKDAPAMDEATVASMIARAVADTKADARATQEALAYVHPWTGNLTIAFDSAEQVYKHALKHVGATYDPSYSVPAMRALIAASPRPGARRDGGTPPVHVATDSARSADFLKRFPGAANIEVHG